MTTDRRWVALALIPAAAGVFGASVSWAGSHDPLAAAAPTTVAAPSPTLDPARIAQDQQMADLAAQVEATRLRIAELQAALAAQTANAQAPAAPSRQQAAPAPAPAPAPKVQAVTGASG